MIPELALDINSKRVFFSNFHEFDKKKVVSLGIIDNA